MAFEDVLPTAFSFKDEGMRAIFSINQLVSGAERRTLERARLLLDPFRKNVIKAVVLMSKSWTF